MAAVNLEVLLFACRIRPKTSVIFRMHASLCSSVLTAMAQPGRLDELHYWVVARTLGGDGFALLEAAGRDVM